MRLLKFFVILGGIVILVGFALLAQRFAQRQMGPAESSNTSELKEESTIDIAADGWVALMTPNGSGLALLVESMEEPQELLLLDRNGRLVRRIHFRPAAATSGLEEPIAANRSSHAAATP